MSGRRTYVGQGLLWAIGQTARTWWAWMPVVILAFLAAFVFGPGWNWISFLIEYEGHRDCTVTAITTTSAGFSASLSLSDGSRAYNFTAASDFDANGINCRDLSSSGGLASDIVSDIGVGDRITCYLKRGKPIASYDGPVYVFPTLRRNCFIHKFMPALVICPILSFFYLCGVLVTLKPKVSKPGTCLNRTVGRFFSLSITYIWAVLYIVAIIIFASLFFSNVFFSITTRAECTIHAKGRRIHCLRCYNVLNNNREPRTPSHWCSHSMVCTKGITGHASLYDAWVDVTYTIPSSSAVFSVSADSDIVASPEGRGSSSSPRISSYLANIAINSTIPCFVSVYGSSGDVWLDGYNPEERDPYILSVTFMLLFPIIFILVGACICCRRRHCPRFCYIDTWSEPIRFDPDSGSYTYDTVDTTADDYTYGASTATLTDDDDDD
ncbi:uncharacterized protein AMSG_00496 [Thecamonas trahens ATCC 50062]|uniref:Uncharacterized protein n=1 Tax=Thecamonas trahens ATCC 50062 TaxID=461836 RepID=A0A0L0D9I4_THETB|nr:hypothetical protein AMSG_00496 [Thecamonas trahens ATCC 50062]KNC48721.1 hypothetical protein AMSG_00496 [Thecamonas trahens ATCC 50062]|eukprot:XP_013762773.1 hypothetical protein AMSG_00496 [Thecamonas trahens ATCC 50062]